jgi:hypothetical protein
MKDGEEGKYLPLSDFIFSSLFTLSQILLGGGGFTLKTSKNLSYSALNHLPQLITNF